MNVVGIRDTLTEKVEAAWVSHPTIPLYFENTETPDLNQLPAEFLYCVVEFLNAEQINLSATPDTRNSGTLEIQAYVKEKTGVRTVLTHLAELGTYFGYKNFSGVHLGTPKIEGVVKPPPGLYGKVLVVPFFADSNA